MRLLTASHWSLDPWSQFVSLSRRDKSLFQTIQMLGTIKCPAASRESRKNVLFHERSYTGAREARFVTGYKDTALGHFVCRCDTRLGKQRRIRLLPSLRWLRWVGSLPVGSAPRAVWMVKLLKIHCLACPSCCSRGEGAQDNLHETICVGSLYKTESSLQSSRLINVIKLNKINTFGLMFPNSRFGY